VFEHLLKAPYALSRHRQSPLAEERHRFLIHCEELRFSISVRRSIAAYLIPIAEYLNLRERPDELICSAEIEDQADRWAKRGTGRAKNARTSGSRKHFVTYATHWLKFMGRLQPLAVVPYPHADRVEAFADYMRWERGLSPQTVAIRCWVAREFLDLLCACRSLEEVTPTHVDDALLGKLHQQGYARASVRSYAESLRAFFRYAQTRGWCRPGLAEAIHAPRMFSHDTLPSGPSWDDVQRLLATTEGNSPVAVRDRAILLLLSVYGCRAGEAVRLRLEDLDWQREQIQFTRSKSSLKQVYPLTRSVGDAILRYLKEVRPNSSLREVFMSLNAPVRPLGRDALWWVVSRRLRSLGLSLRHYGPHALRHSCATRLLEQGFTIKEIGDHLGHRHPDATSVYAKVDLAGLRQVAAFEMGGLL
jgi:integrase/recombinase XerD